LTLERLRFGSVALVATLVAAGCDSRATSQRDGGPDAPHGGTGGSAGTGGSTGGTGGSGGSSGTGGTGGSAGTGGTAGTGGSAGTGGASDAGFDAGADATGTGGARDAGVDLGAATDAGGNHLRDRFPPMRPATITANGVITKNDVACVMVGTTTGCLAQNSPPCSASGGQTTVSLTLTIDAQDNITVQAPYQDMCAQDYFCAVSGPSCPIPTSYPVPLVDHLYLYDPRTTDRCRRDSNGTAIQVQHLVDVSTNNSTTVTIHQQCHTRMRNDGTSPTSFVDDTRDWTTVLTF
jgi:hypothetical protein